MDIHKIRHLYYKESPEAALDYVLSLDGNTVFDVVTLLHTYDKLTGGVAGSYHPTSRASLTGRKYRVELVDDCVAIHFTDFVYDSHNFKHIIKDQ